MKRFDNTGLLEALKNYDKSPSTSLTAGDTLLNEFIEDLYAYCRDESCIAERIRTLGFIRSEFATFMENDLPGSKKGAPLRKIIGKAIAAIDSELHIVKMDLEHPDRFLEFPSDNPPLARWGGKISDLIEYFTAPQAAGLLQHPSGQPMDFDGMCQWLEKNFGITISNPGDRRAKVLDRQKNTTFQDEMRQVYLLEAKKRDK